MRTQPARRSYFFCRDNNLRVKNCLHGVTAEILQMDGLDRRQSVDPISLDYIWILFKADEKPCLKAGNALNLHRGTLGYASH